MYRVLLVEDEEIEKIIKSGRELPKIAMEPMPTDSVKNA